MADIVVYGGSFAAAAAASKAAAEAPNKTVVVIIPDPAPEFGSIGTIGGQNYFDTRDYNSQSVIAGSFSWWYSLSGQFYGVDEMAARLKSDVTKYSNVTVYYGYDICNFSTASGPYRITQLTIKRISRNSAGVVVWGSGTATVTGTVFIDASDDGRLARIANSACTVGRYDWPAIDLDLDEKGATGKARQQAATLMFKVTGVDRTAGTTDMHFIKSKVTDTYACWGGSETYSSAAAIKNFNDKYGPQGYAIKPLNAAQDGAGSSEWWVNTLLVFNVDGRAYNRDKGTSLFPSDMRSDYKTVDDAWVQARNFIKNTPDFLKALRCFPGFKNACLVMDNTGCPVVGKVMYLRETIHMSRDSAKRGNGTEDTNYALTASACNAAGKGSADGKDSVCYASRIGLNYYWSDINAYKFGDMKNTAGGYIWGSDIGKKLRPQMNITGDTPSCPVYVPYHVLTTNYVANLLICGYAAGIASFGWSECRVIPNLCVLGDAAGVSAAYAVKNGKQPTYLALEDIAVIQTALRKYGARLDK